MSSISKRSPRALFPVLIIFVLAFILYTIIDSAIIFKHISFTVMIGSVIVFMLLVYAIVRFELTRYEYLVVGEKLIIRRSSPLRGMRVKTYSLESIVSIGKVTRFKHLAHTKYFNCCNSIITALFSGTVMLYRNKDRVLTQRVIIDPPDDVQRVLKLNLQERYKI